VASLPAGTVRTTPRAPGRLWGRRGRSSHNLGSMRIVVVGAGAVGGVVAANLAIAGTSVVAVARGEHGRVIRESGLRYESPVGTTTVELPVVAAIGEIEFTDDDVILLGVKSQDTVGVLNDLRAAGVTGQPIVCMQNGVENERLALRLFPNVYGMVVMLPADHHGPGVVRVWTAPSSGLLDIGRYPHGVDDLCVELAATLRAATFGSIPRDDIMSWKYRKLLMNLGNAIEAVCGREGFAPLIDMVQAEGEAALAAAGISVISVEDDQARRGDALTIQPVGDDHRRAGGSTWQSLRRGTGAIETDYLTGEIVLLGRLHGVPTPANLALQTLAAEMARAGEPPASRTVDDVLRAIDSA
jgi:2-dehydropantoate 2-reductase